MVFCVSFITAWHLAATPLQYLLNESMMKKQMKKIHDLLLLSGINSALDIVL